MMTETILRIQLSELEIVRIVCRKDGCKGVIEVPLEEMAGHEGASTIARSAASNSRVTFPKVRSIHTGSRKPSGS